MARRDRQHVAGVVCVLALSGCANLNAPPSPSAPASIATSPALTAPAPATPRPPADSAFIEERARQAVETGRWDVAEGYYLQLTRARPGDAEPWFQLGNLYAEQGRLDSAERAYREALRRRDEVRTLHNLGLVQIKLGIGALREAQRRLPADDPIQEQTREFLRGALEAAAP